jgi:hypothetical protein
LIVAKFIIQQKIIIIIIIKQLIFDYLFKAPNYILVCTPVLIAIYVLRSTPPKILTGL